MQKCPLFRNSKMATLIKTEIKYFVYWNLYSKDYNYRRSATKSSPLLLSTCISILTSFDEMHYAVIDLFLLFTWNLIDNHTMKAVYECILCFWLKLFYIYNFVLMNVQTRLLPHRTTKLNFKLNAYPNKNRKCWPITLHKPLYQVWHSFFKDTIQEEKKTT